MTCPLPRAPPQLLRPGLQLHAHLLRVGPSSPEGDRYGFADIESLYAGDNVLGVGDALPSHGHDDVP